MKRNDWTWVIISLVCIVVTTMLTVSAVWIIKNADNKITEGIVVDKTYRSAYTTHRTQMVNKGVIEIPEYHPETYQMCIEGKKNGETVKYWFSCPAEEWNAYKIGDYYKR